MRGRVLICLSLTAFVADRLIKSWFQNFPEGKVFSFLPGLEFGHYLNPALFFFPAWRFIPWLALLILVVLVVFIATRGINQSLNSIPYSLFPIALGGASNVFDRFIYKGVIDYVNILGFATINLADILIFTGLIFTLIQSYDQRR